MSIENERIPTILRSKTRSYYSLCHATSVALVSTTAPQGSWKVSEQRSRYGPRIERPILSVEPFLALRESWDGRLPASCRPPSVNRVAPAVAVQIVAILIAAEFDARGQLYA
jgi:hypothetical protein